MEEAAAILRISPRQVNRYGHGDDARLRTRRAGRRILYHREDVLTLADDLDVSSTVQTAKPLTLEIMPPGDVLDYIREKDQQVLELAGRLAEATHRIGHLEALLEEREREVKRLQDQEQRPAVPAQQDAPVPKRAWWKRILRTR